MPTLDSPSSHLTNPSKTAIGDPISLILARLQTAPQVCACGCTVPDPPKHSDYYHAQHLLRLLFQTQRVRSRSLKVHLPEFFERLAEEEEYSGGDDVEEDSESDGDGEGKRNQEQGWGQGHSRDSVVIPIDGVNNSTTTLTPLNQHLHHQQQSYSHSHPQRRKKKEKPPRYIHSLIQNRAFRNPLTNTEIEGDPTFFAVLEPGKGGWWHEPWAMAKRPQGVQGFHSLVHQHYHQGEGVNGKEGEEKEEKGRKGDEEKRKELEKELRKERWRQGRIVNLELEAQHEMDWRRWNRSQATFAAESVAAEVGQGQSNVGGRKRERGRRMMRMKLSKDIALLYPSERGLRLPRRARSSSLSLADTNADLRHHRHHQRGERTPESSFSLSNKKKETAVDSETMVANINRATLAGGLYRPSAIQASAVLDDVEVEDIYLNQKLQDQDQEQQDDDVEMTKKEAGQHQMLGLLGRRRRMSKKWKRRLARVHRPFTPPSSAPSASASTSASPSSLEGFSFLPWWDPDPHPFEMPTTKLSPFAISTLPEPVAKLFGGTSIYSRIPSKSSASTNFATTNISPTTTTTAEAPSGRIPKHTNTEGCQWIPVKHGDRVAVMIGTSKDFLLFPSFQRLLFRNLSREDFEDRVARVNRIACPATAIVVTNSGASGASGSSGARGVEQQMRGQGTRMQEEIRQQQERVREREEREGVSAMEGGGEGEQDARSTRLSSWRAWMSPRRRQQGDGTNNGDNTTTSTLTMTAVSTSGGAGAESGTRPPLPPSNESTTAFVTSSNTSRSSSRRSFASAPDHDHIDGEKREGLDDNESRMAPANNNNRADPPNSHNMVDLDTVDEKAPFELKSPPNTILSTAATRRATTITNNIKETCEREEARRQWQVLQERFLREDYDSSEYSYAPSSDEEEEEDEFPWDYDGSYYSTEESESSDDGDDEDEYGSDGNGEGRSRATRRQQRQQGGETGSGGGARPRSQWKIKDWFYFFACCAPHPRTLTSTSPSTSSSSTSNAGRQAEPLESRRSRRRRLRRERWLRTQHRQREQECVVLHRYLPLAIRRRMTAQDVHRVCMVAEFCRFYLTILMSLLIVGAIVYGAVNVEASPKDPRAAGVPTAARLELVAPAETGSGGGGGGSLRRAPGQWATTTTTSVEGIDRGGSRSVVWKGETKEGDNVNQQQQQQPLGMVEF